MNFLMTMCWSAMDMIGGLILFDSFARWRKNRLWWLWCGAILLFSTVYLLVVPSAVIWKILLILPQYVGLYTACFRDDGGPLFRVCLALIYYGITCNLDNLVATFVFARVDPSWSYGQADRQSFLLGLAVHLLDNAVEAGMALPREERRIQVKALLCGNEFFFSVRNRSRPVTVPRGGLPASTKADPDLHGYGLQNVVTILHKYRALYDMHWEDGWFQFVTELPNTTPAGR